MRLFLDISLFLIFLFMGQFAQAGTWTLVDNNTLSFEGGIDASDLEKFKGLFSPKIKKLILHSDGGDAEAALGIGRILITQEVDVEVHTACLSACANYLFTAGKRKVISEAIVGFHGNVTALVLGHADDLSATLKKAGLTDSQIAQTIEHYKSQVIPLEQEYFQKLRIPQSFFDRTQTLSKGMDSGEYSFLLPAVETFKKYGFSGVEGEQSPEWLNKYNELAKQAGIAPAIIN